jgi:two-component system, response regulator PdtaR
MDTPLRVIIADDESLVRMDLREALMALGYMVVGEASNGEASLAVARQQHPGLTILDARMPRLDSIGAASILTGQEHTPDYADAELVERARAAAVASHLVKPFREADLPPAVEPALAPRAAA